MTVVRRWTGKEAQALRKAMRLSIRGFADYLGAGARTVAAWESSGENITPRPELQSALDTTLSRADAEVRSRFQLLLGDPGPQDNPALARAEAIRQGVTNLLGTGASVPASIDEWDAVVASHGRATRSRPGGELFDDLLADFTELQRTLGRRHAAPALRSLTRVTAQMAGLMFLTLIKLNQPGAARKWAWTARVAADEAGDPSTRSWVRAQEAYVHYYSGNLTEALEVARHAQRLAGSTACAGYPLAAALEARAESRLGREAETRTAIDRAEAGLARLDHESLASSAFGYNEAQLRFHQGNALTHLGDTSGAQTAHDRALSLYPAADFLDPALVRLDHASCLARDGEHDAALSSATAALLATTEQQRRGLLTVRGWELLHQLPQSRQTQSIAREYRDLLALTTD